MKKLYILSLALLFSLHVAGQVDWHKHGTPVLEKGADGSWEENGVGFPTVLQKGDTLHMWYAGLNDENLAIGHAFSLDGGLTWTKNSQNPVLSPGPAGSFDEQRAYFPKVIYHDGMFHMWYLGAKDDYELTGYATSTDGVNWTKDPSNPVGESGTGAVLYKDDLFHMWFNYGIGITIQTGYATSPDGKTWTENENKPVIPNGGSSNWDYPRVQASSVVFKSGAFHLFYSGGSFYNWQEGYATSSDGITWTKNASNPVLPTGEGGAWDSKYTSFSSVIYDETNNTWKMWYYGGTTDFQGSIGYAEAWNVSAQDYINSASINVYPNPVKHILNIKTGTDLNGTLEIFSLTGQLTYSGQIHQPANSIDISFLEKGIYIVKVCIEGNIETKKIVKL